MVDVAFKEWAAVCVAIAHGTQTVILRKGGIAEENGVFTPEYAKFWLWPTFYHTDRSDSVKPGEWLDVTKPEPGTVVLRTIVDVVTVDYVTKLEDALALENQHILLPHVVEQRFHYRTPGLYVLRVNATNVEPITIDEHPEDAGCKTWVKLTERISSLHGSAV